MTLNEWMRRVIRDEEVGHGAKVLDSHDFDDHVDVRIGLQRIERHERMRADRCGRAVLHHLHEGGALLGA